MAEDAVGLRREWGEQEVQPVTPAKQRLQEQPPAIRASPPDDAPDSPADSSPPQNARVVVPHSPHSGSHVRTDAVDSGQLALAASSGTAGHEHATASPEPLSTSSLQSLANGALPPASGTAVKGAVVMPRQHWDTTAARKEGTARVAADDPQIRTIFWSGRHGSTRGTEAEVIALARALCGSTHVQQVSIRHSPEAITMASMGAMLSALRKCPTLVSLDMGLESTTPHQRKVMRTASIANACLCLSGNDPQLQVIDWSGSNGFTDAEAEQLASALRNNTYLRELKLDNNTELTDDGACILLPAICTTGITRIGLRGTSISKSVQAKIATPCLRNALQPVMRNDPACRVLDLGLFSGIVDDHLCEVALALRKSTYLRVIKLGFNEHLTDCGLQTLLVALQQSTVERVAAPLRASEAMQLQLKHVCKINRARNVESEEDVSARQSEVTESPLARWRRAGTAAIMCSLPPADAKETDHDDAGGEVAAEAKLLEASLLADAAEAEAAQRELARMVALRVGKRDVKAMRKSDAMRRQIRSEVLAENRARLAIESSAYSADATQAPALIRRVSNPRRSKEATESVINHLLNQLIDEVERQNPTLDENYWEPVAVDPAAARAVAMRVSARQNTAVALKAFIHRK